MSKHECFFQPTGETKNIREFNEKEYEKKHIKGHLADYARFHVVIGTKQKFICECGKVKWVKEK